MLPPAMAGVPDGVHERVVMADGAIDGRAVSVSSLQAGLDVDAVLARYRSVWRREGGTVIGPVGQGTWRILSRRLPSGLETVQLRATRGGAEGFRTVWPDAAPGVPEKALPAMPEGFSRQRLLSSRDAGRRSVTLLAVGDVPIDGARQRWMRSLRDDGWTTAAPPGAQRDGPDGAPRWFRKGDAIAALDVSANAGRVTALLVLEWPR